VTDAFAQAPQTGTQATPGFLPFVIGDLVAGGAPTTFQFLPAPGARPSTGNPNIVIGPGGVPIQRVVLATPSTARGAFKITDNESPRPVDRFFLTYNYFNGVGAGIPNFPTFDLHRQVFGFEKTFLDGDASISVRLNTLQAAGDGSLRSNDFGDTTIVSKFALINEPNGNVLSVGFAVTAPTGPDQILLDGTRLHPTLLQPYAGYIYAFDRLYTQGFASLIIPTDDRDVLLSTSSVAVGYQLYRAADPWSRMLTYVTPTTEAHATIPLNHRGLESQPVGFPDLVVITNGIHFGLGNRSNLLLGVATPVTGPKLFDLEGIAQFNFRY
jgi:hypothetical protein